MRKMTSLLLAAGMTMALLSGCGGGTEAKETTAAQTTAAETKAEETTAAESKEAETKAAEVKAPEKDVEMQYMSVEDAHSNLGKDGYTFLDVRKAEDHKTSCVPGSVGVDMDAAKGGDFQAGVTAMQPIVDEHDDNLVIICYSGKSYAQATTNVLSALGYDMSKVYTLVGGYKAWTKAYADEVEVAQEIKAPEKDVEMQYMTVEEAAEKAGADGYTFFDVRKAADYAEGHIPGAVSADMDAAKEGDFNAGVSTMQVATRDMDDTLVLVCYSGKRYAQATTNVLSALGYDMSKVYTLEGGFTKWSETYPDQIEK